MSNKAYLAKISLDKVPHLANYPGPEWISKAITELGEVEVAGAKSNPRILEYRRMASCTLGGDDGAVPWCAIFVNAMLAQSAVKGTGSAMARSFANSKDFERLEKPMVGCITVISSNRGPASGHVFFYAGENGLFFFGLGGNQSDAVSVDAFHKSKLVGHYWPKGIAKNPAPFNQPVRLARTGAPPNKPVRDA